MDGLPRDIVWYNIPQSAWPVMMRTTRQWRDTILAYQPELVPDEQLCDAIKKGRWWDVLHTVKMRFNQLSSLTRYQLIHTVIETRADWLVYQLVEKQNILNRVFPMSWAELLFPAVIGNSTWCVLYLLKQIGLRFPSSATGVKSMINKTVFQAAVHSHHLGWLWWVIRTGTGIGIWTHEWSSTDFEILSKAPSRVLRLVLRAIPPIDVKCTCMRLFRHALNRLDFDRANECLVKIKRRSPNYSVYGFLDSEHEYHLQAFSDYRVLTHLNSFRRQPSARR